MTAIDARIRKVFLVAAALAALGTFPNRGFAQPEGEKLKQQAPSPKLTAQQQAQLKEAVRLNREVYRLWKAGEYAKAIPPAQEALRIRKEILGLNHANTGLSLLNLGAQYMALAKYAKVEPLYVQACDIYKKALGEEHPRYAGSLKALAMLYKAMGKYEKAEPLFVQALDICKKVVGEEHPNYASTLSGLALVYQAMGEYGKAEPLYVRCRDIYRKVLGEEDPNYAKSLSNLAGLYEARGEYAKAEPLFVQALDIHKKVMGDEHADYATSLNNLALLYNSMGEYAKAEPLYVQACDIRKKVLGEEHPNYAESLSNLATLYHEMGEYAKAEPLYVQALDIKRKVLGEGHPDYATTLNNLALLYQATGEYAKAEPPYVRACDIHKKVLGEGHPNYATSLNNLAGLYEAMGDYVKAEPLYVQALDIYRKVLGEGHPNYATSLNNLAGLYKDMGEYANAEPLYVQVRDIWKKRLGQEHPYYASSLNNLAALYYEMGEYAKAESLFVKGHDIYMKVLGPRHPSYARSVSNLAVVYHCMRQYAKAEPLAQAGMDVETMFANNVIAFLPEARAMALRANLKGPAFLLSVLRKMPQHSDRAAYTAVWRTRGLVSRSLAVRRQGLGQSPEAEALWARLRTTAQQLAQLTLAVPRPDQREARQRRLAELNDEKERLEAELARLSAEFRRNQELAATKPEDLVRLLRQDDAIVELLRVAVWSPPPGGRGKPVSEWHYDAFVLRRGDGREGMNVAWVELGPATAIDNAVTQWRRAIMGKLAATAEARQAAEDLRRSVWDKIEPHLAGCSTVIVVPDGRLCFLPWAALPGRGPGTCLLEDYAVATAPGARQLYAMLTEPKSAQGKLLLVGGVAYDAEPSAGPGQAVLLASDPTASSRTRSPAMNKRLHWDPLPQTVKEVEAIGEAWSGGTAPVVLRGAGASERALREHLPGSRYIHLATHGFFADPQFRSMFGHDVQGEQLFGGSGLLTARRARVTVRNPLILSGAVLAGANLPPKTDKLGLPTGEDGILTAEEIVNLDLRGTELAVLSACDTGLGEVAGGEGVFGLQRAFHLAGVYNVVASLWKVDDAATAALMRLFYHKLWQENKPPIVALREAQLAVYRHPEQIPKIATTRGPDFTKTVQLVEGRRPGPRQKTAPTKLWAAFVISGAGR